MKDKEGVYEYAKYSSFYIGGSSTDYTLHISGFNGSSGVGDSLGFQIVINSALKTMPMMIILQIVQFYLLVHGGRTIVSILILM